MKQQAIRVRFLFVELSPLKRFFFIIIKDESKYNIQINKPFVVDTANLDFIICLGPEIKEATTAIINGSK